MKNKYIPIHIQYVGYNHKYVPILGTTKNESRVDWVLVTRFSDLHKHFSRHLPGPHNLPKASLILQHCNLSPWKPLSPHLPCLRPLLRLWGPTLQGRPRQGLPMPFGQAARVPPTPPHELLFPLWGRCVHVATTWPLSEVICIVTRCVSSDDATGQAFAISQVRSSGPGGWTTCSESQPVRGLRRGGSPEQMRTQRQVLCLQMIRGAAGRMWGTEPGGETLVRGLDEPALQWAWGSILLGDQVPPGLALSPRVEGHPGPLMLLHCWLAPACRRGSACSTGESPQLGRKDAGAPGGRCWPAGNCLQVDSGG